MKVDAIEAGRMELVRQRLLLEAARDVFAKLCLIENLAWNAKSCFDLHVLCGYGFDLSAQERVVISVRIECFDAVPEVPIGIQIRVELASRHKRSVGGLKRRRKIGEVVQ